LVYIRICKDYNPPRALEKSCSAKKAFDRVTCTPALSTNAKALGFSTKTVTESLPKSIVAVRAMEVARASTV
jgi:hypothetical protein